jgi:hypothetical protein
MCFPVFFLQAKNSLRNQQGERSACSAAAFQTLIIEELLKTNEQKRAAKYVRHPGQAKENGDCGEVGCGGQTTPLSGSAAVSPLHGVTEEVDPALF